jgi:hypothetical protein
LKIRTYLSYSTVLQINEIYNFIYPTAIKLTMEEAAAQSFAFFVAGFETSSATASYALYELAKHENMQKNFTMKSTKC